MKDKSIFGIRFGSNGELAPSAEELGAFLMSPKSGRARETHGSDLVNYEKLLEGVLAFERHLRQDAGALDPPMNMFYRALGHSQFFSPALSSAVAQYKYHLHTLNTLDFRKPAVFIKSAEEEMKKLNPKKKQDAIKLARLQDMVEERNRAIAMLKRSRSAIAGELGNITRYISDNLNKIRKLCEASIVVLVDAHISRKKESQLIEDIKTHFREHLRDSLHLGPVTRQYAEDVRQDAAVLEKELSGIVRDDIYTLTRLFESIHNHTKNVTREINSLMATYERTRSGGIEDDRLAFSNIEQVLVSLISECRFEFKPAAFRSETAHEQVLREKRKEMLDHLFDLLQKERRARDDRRAGEDRRKFHDPSRQGEERRTGKERRSRKSRRQ